MTAFPLILLLLSLFLLNHSLSTAANIHKKGHFRPKLKSHLSKTNITTFFEVTKPIQVPRTKPCSYLLLQHDFGHTYELPPVLANYTPPSDCQCQNFAKIVLQWEAKSNGTQFDRIFGVWLGGVELLRSCTAEPTATGIVWTVKKDITRYYSLLMSNQTLAVYLGNIVTNVYTGVYHVILTVHFYPAEVSTGINGNILTTVNKSVSSVGWVKSSYGKITTNSTQRFDFSNFMVLREGGNLQIVNQTISFNDSVHAKLPSSSVLSIKSTKRFPLYLYTDEVEEGNATFLLVTNLTLGYNEKKRVKAGDFGLFDSSLKNLRNGQGVLLVVNNSVVAGIGSTQEVYRYDDSTFCYFRNVSSSNYTILYDKEGKSCRK
ncbi:hypothetical protein RHMOL_Rhmol04G0044400 [Rhododendron molle]|uniref:Uncharacterized protein n=1 Tax=Rhododendron molle TaxID=49168 RepID=A0ACC0NYA6_RHOML|nr:hypothetical protein RHMOL_Rhmol04G0044400 [Rhododendron molle]